MSEQPWTFERAYRAHEDASREQESAEQELGGKNHEYAQAEEAYRKALALEMWRLRNEDGVAWSALADLARGADHVAELKRTRDLAEGERTVASHAVYRRSSDRSDTERFIDWSMRRDLAEGHGRIREPDGMPVIGGRRAA